MRETADWHNSIPYGLLVLLGAVMMCASGCAASGRQETLTIGAAMDAARQNNKIVIVEYWGFSQDCADMDRKVYPDAQVKADLEDFIRVRVNYDLFGDQARRMGVTVTPGFAALRPDGSVIVAAQGRLDMDGYRQFLSRAKIQR